MVAQAKTSASNLIAALAGGLPPVETDWFFIAIMPPGEV